MSAKFKPGDPVWARSDGSIFPAGEYAAVILSLKDEHCPGHNAAWYRLDVFAIGPAPFGDGWILCEHYIRPRRDDYQQHEPRVSWTDLRDSLRAPEKEPA